MVLKYMRHLETVDLSGNDMTDDSVSDMEAMIVNFRNCIYQTVTLIRPLLEYLLKDFMLILVQKKSMSWLAVFKTMNIAT